ncbi:MAG: S8 family serine peptidase [Bryobacteraceae bacterium]
MGAKAAKAKSITGKVPIDLPPGGPITIQPPPFAPAAPGGGTGGTPWKPHFRDALPDAPVGLPEEHEGEIIVELKPDAITLSRANPLGMASTLVELLAMLQRQNGLLRVEPLWPVGVSLFPKLPPLVMRMLPPAIREFVLMMSANQPVAAEPGFADLREDARLRLKLTLDPSKPTADAIKSLLTHAGVAFAEGIPYRWVPVFDPFTQSEMQQIFTPPPQPGDEPQYYAGPNGYWGRTEVFAPDVWTEYELDNIAILDSGCDEKHVALQDAVTWLTPESRTDLAAHGTFVAGIIAARSTVASQDLDGRIDPEHKADVERGLLPKAKLTVMNIMSRKPKYDETGRAYYPVDPGRYSQGLAKIAKMKKIRVLNLSIGGPKPTSKTEAKDLAALEKAGVVVVASAGNGRDNSDPVLYPALYDTSLSVGAIRFTEPRHAPWDKSRSSFPDNYSGGRESAVDVWAPGEWILSAVPMDAGRDIIFSGWQNGTSMASPFVTATAAVLCAKFPEATPAEIRQMISELKRQGMDDNLLMMDGGGRRLVCDSVTL